MTTFQYPGVNLDLRHKAHGSWRDPAPTYPIGLSESTGADSDVLPMREVAMMMLMDKLTDKPNWHAKVFDEEIVQKWRDEAREQSEDALFARIMQGKESLKIPKPRSRIISDEAFDFCIKELRNKAAYYDQTGLIPTFDSAGNAIVKSDRLIGATLRQDLLKAFDTLRADQEVNVDWHPRSNDMVHDLVHPSMYPFVYDRSNFIQEEVVGVSNALAFVGQAKTVPKGEGGSGTIRSRNMWGLNISIGSGETAPEFWSDTFQWLPANVAFRDDGGVKITSYINNLHPTRYPAIYGTIEKAIHLAIPVWDQCLRECNIGGAVDAKTAGRLDSRFEAIEEASDEDDDLWSPPFDIERFKSADIPWSKMALQQLDHLPPWVKKFEQLETEISPDEQNRIDDLLRKHYPDDESLARAKWEDFREAILPQPKEFEEIDYSPAETLADKFQKSGLQVIVKMASIELTPEKPEFPAGGWHIEGQMNEKICATALFYIDSENVTPSHLSFRMQTSSYFSDEVQAGQDQYNYLERVCGTPLGPSNGVTAPCLQTFGEVETPQGRLVAFPNVFQHRVSSFRLQDPTKPGHRRFLALWLIDPHRRIISTANVPPQQMDWWTDAGGKVPEGLMTAEEAREHRLKLMDERSAYHELAEDTWNGVEYSFCEH